MKKIELFQAVGEIDDELLADAEAFLNGTAAARKRPNPWIKWGGLAACLAVVVCAFWAVSLRGESGQPQPSAAPSPEITQSTSSVNVDRPAIEPEPEAVTRPVIQMNFNQLDKEPEQSTAAMFALLWEDFVPMTREELLDYYGVSLPVEELFPTLSATGPEEGNGFGRGIYRREGRGVYFDTNTFAFESTDGILGVYVTLDKVSHIHTAPWELPGDRLEFTTINGWELALFCYPDEEGNQYFYTEFEQNGVNYRVCGKNRCEQEYAAVLSELLEEREANSAGKPRTFIGTYSGGIGHQFLTTTNPDGSETVEKSWHGPLHLSLEDGAEYTSLSVELTPEQAEQFADLSIGDRVAVAFTGEPATIRTVWPQQLISLEKVEE